MKKGPAITAYLTEEDKKKLIEYQATFQLKMGKRISQQEIVSMAIHFFLSRKHDWPKG